MSVMPARAAGATSFVQGRGIQRLVGACSRPRIAPLRRLARADKFDAAAALLFAALVALVLFTFKEYAISNDEEVQQRYGEMIVAYYASGLADQALFHFRDLYLYGGLFDLVAVGLEKLLPLDAYDVRHLLTAVIGVGGIAAAWATARAIGGARAALVAAAALAACGIWYGAMFNHTKDIPFAAAMMGATYFLLKITRELPRPRWRLVLLFGVCCGCALGIRVLGLLLIVYAAGAVLLYAPLPRRGAWRATLAFAARAALPLAAAFVLAYAIMLAAWPWAALEPLNPLRAVSAFADFHYRIRTVLDGQVYYMADVPRWYVPTYVVIKLTLLLLVGAALALGLMLLPQYAAAARSRAWRRETALIALAAFLPLACEVVTGGPAFTGMRHFLFIVPPLAVLAGLGVDDALSRLHARSSIFAAGAAALVLLDLGVTAATLYRLHPHEYLFYNALVGGLAGAADRYATDYWVNMMPEAVNDLERFLDRTDVASDKTRSRHRYLVAVCGERLPFEKAADARLQWTRDVRQAEFFIAPTHMHCDRAFDGRVVATVSRLGVVIGVVKDRRAIVVGAVAGGHAN